MLCARNTLFQEDYKRDPMFEMLSPGTAPHLNKNRLLLKNRRTDTRNYNALSTPAEILP